MPPASIQVPIKRFAPDRLVTDDLVTVEEPLEIRVGSGPKDMRVDETISITMRTPGNDEELALGFLFTEGVVQDLKSVESISTSNGSSSSTSHNIVRVALRADVEFDPSQLTRHFYTTSSCGVCGKTSLELVNAQAEAANVSRGSFTISSKTLGSLPEKLRAQQAEFKRTGALHATASVTANGEIDRVREDVGRHNALDKLIGSYLREESLELRNKGILLSGRASFELIQKTAMTGAAFVAAIGPPSSLAIELAKQHDITLLGFLKASSYNVYVESNRGTVSHG